MSIPELNISAEERAKLQTYLQSSREALQDVAFAGPSAATDEEGSKRLWLICAYDLAKGEPEDEFNFLNLANAFYANGLLEEAIAVYEDIEKRGATFLGHYDDPLFNIGLVRAEQKNFDAAIVALSEVSRRFPEASAQIAYYLGAVHHGAGNFPKARQEYEKCLRSLGNSERSQKVRAKIESLLRDVGNSVTFSERLKSPWQEFIH